MALPYGPGADPIATCLNYAEGRIENYLDLDGFLLFLSYASGTEPEDIETYTCPTDLVQKFGNIFYGFIDHDFITDVLKLLQIIDDNIPMWSINNKRIVTFNNTDARLVSLLIG